MRKDDSVYLRDMLDAIDRANRHLRVLLYDQFLQNETVQDGVIRQLEIIGEAARHVSPVFQDAHPGIPWRDIIGLRNRLIHDYPGVNLAIVWEIARYSLPELRAQITRILNLEE